MLRSPAPSIMRYWAGASSISRNCPTRAWYASSFLTSVFALILDTAPSIASGPGRPGATECTQHRLGRAKPVARHVVRPLRRSTAVPGRDRVPDPRRAAELHRLLIATCGDGEHIAL